MSFTNRVYELTRKIPSGKVSTYKMIACALNTKAYQAVGIALKNNPYAPQVPCHRVVAADGSIGGFMGKTTGKEIRKKISMLKHEGVHVVKNKIVNFQEVLFEFS